MGKTYFSLGIVFILLLVLGSYFSSRKNKRKRNEEKRKKEGNVYFMFSLILYLAKFHPFFFFKDHLQHYLLQKVYIFLSFFLPLGSSVISWCSPCEIVHEVKWLKILFPATVAGEILNDITRHFWLNAGNIRLHLLFQKSYSMFYLHSHAQKCLFYNWRMENKIKIGKAQK